MLSIVYSNVYTGFAIAIPNFFYNNSDAYVLTGPQLNSGSNITVATCSESRISSIFTSNMVVMTPNSFYLEFNYYLDECGGGGQLAFVFQSEGYAPIISILVYVSQTFFLGKFFRKCSLLIFVRSYRIPCAW